MDLGSLEWERVKKNIRRWTHRMIIPCCHLKVPHLSLVECSLSQKECSLVLILE